MPETNQDPEIVVDAEVEIRGSLQIRMKLSRARELAARLDRGDCPDMEEEREFESASLDDMCVFTAEINDIQFHDPSDDEEPDDHEDDAEEDDEDAARSE